MRGSLLTTVMTGCADSWHAVDASRTALSGAIWLRKNWAVSASPKSASAVSTAASEFAHVHCDCPVALIVLIRAAKLFVIASHELAICAGVRCQSIPGVGVVSTPALADAFAGTPAADTAASKTAASRPRDRMSSEPFCPGCVKFGLDIQVRGVEHLAQEAQFSGRRRCDAR